MLIMNVTNTWKNGILKTGAYNTGHSPRNSWNMLKATRCDKSLSTGKTNQLPYGIKKHKAVTVVRDNTDEGVLEYGRKKNEGRIP